MNCKRPSTDIRRLPQHYFPAIAELDRRRLMPIPVLLEALGGRGRVIPIPVPYDCRDGFTPAYWRRPWAYVDPEVRTGNLHVCLDQRRSTIRGGSSSRR